MKNSRLRSVGTTIDFGVTIECRIDLARSDTVPVNLLVRLYDGKYKSTAVPLSFEKVPVRKSNVLIIRSPAPEWKFPVLREVR